MGGAFNLQTVSGDTITIHKHLEGLRQLPLARAAYIALLRATVDLLPVKNRAQLVARQQAVAGELQRQAQGLQIAAPFAGMVATVAVQDHDAVTRDQALLTVVDLSAFEVEFDLAAMMDGQAFSDFVLLWLVCHQSRVEGDPAETCWLEKWATAAREEGTRTLDELRDDADRAPLR